MGMFDYIEHSYTCDCGNVVDDFQSKDGPCQLLTLTPLQVNNFYSNCDKCHTRLNFSRYTALSDTEIPEFGRMEDYRLERRE